MSTVYPLGSSNRQFMSGNEAVARGIWEAGCRVASAYPGTPATEIMEYAACFEEMYTEWSVNEKVSLEVAIGASLAGSRSFCAMKHVGMNVASDALMTQTLIGVGGGLVIAIADDVGLSSSQNEQDSRYWGRFAHLPILEPCDSQEAYEMAKQAFEISEEFDTPVIVRLTTRICHVKAVVLTGVREERDVAGFAKDPSRYVMVPGNARHRIPLMYEREDRLRDFAVNSSLNFTRTGGDTRVGFVTSGPVYLHLLECFPDAPVLKLGFSCPSPIELIREFAGTVDKMVVAEEVEPLLEMEIRAAGISAYGKDILPRIGELSPNVLRPAIAKLLGEVVTEPKIPATQPAVKSTSGLADIAIKIFPRPPTMCVACPHLGIYYVLSKVRNTAISGDIGCYTLGAGHPWNALDTCISMGASMGVALGLDKGRPQGDKQRVVAVIGDSTFMHMGMQGLLDITYNKGNVTIMLLDNRAVGMTGGQENPGSGKDIHGMNAPRVDFRKLVEAIGVKPERIHEINPYELPTLFKALRDEVKVDDTSVIITDQPCVLTERYGATPPFKVIDDKCTGCSNCLDVGCPAISVVRRETVIKPNGKEKQLNFVTIDSPACTGCDLCPKTCAPDAIVPVEHFSR